MFGVIGNHSHEFGHHQQFFGVNFVPLKCKCMLKIVFRLGNRLYRISKTERSNVEQIQLLWEWNSQEQKACFLFTFHRLSLATSIKVVKYFWTSNVRKNNLASWLYAAVIHNNWVYLLEKHEIFFILNISYVPGNFSHCFSILLVYAK